MNAGNYDVAIDFSNLFMDDTEPGLAKYLSIDPFAGQPLALEGRELDKLYDDHMRERDPEKRKALIRAFEKRLFEQAYQQPLLWWHRIVPTHKTLMGWKMSPSHNLGAGARRRLDQRVNDRLASPPPPRRGTGPQRDSHASLHHQSRPADDPDAARGGGARVLHVAHRSRRHRRDQAARRRRQPSRRRPSRWSASGSASTSR